MYICEEKNLPPYILSQLIADSMTRVVSKYVSKYVSMYVWDT